jgi:Zn-dependent M28 family amino/carboxypeptidase
MIQAESSLPPALVRIDLEGESDLVRLAQLGIPVFAQLWDDGGQSYLLALADLESQSLIHNAGFSTKALDIDSTGAAYFLVSRRGANHQQDVPLKVLVETNRYQLVRVEAAQVLNFQPGEVEIQRLNLHPLVIPDDGAVPKVSAITPNPAIQAMIDQVSIDSAYDYVGSLSGEWQVTVDSNPYTFDTRYSYAETPIKKATKYVEEHLLNLGLATDFEEYTTLGVPLRNVIAEQPGISDPDCLVLLVGHLDSRSSTHTQSLSLAPGADDNASGSTGVLMAADILHQYRFECTIRYILFTGEEQGMYGSQDYASDAFTRGDDIQAVINLDMIGYNSDQYEVIGLHTRPGDAGDLSVAGLFADVVDAYNINLTPEIVQDGERFSDHSPFWDYGYSAILGIEDYDDFTPDYHLITDTIDTIDFSYMADFIRAAVGTIAHLAGYIPPEQTFFPLITR